MKVPYVTIFTISAAVVSTLGAGSALAASAVIHVGSQQQTGYTVSLDGTQSTGRNPLNEITSSNDKFGIKTYTWNFGDGSPEVTGDYLNTTTYKYESAGSYTVTLSVKDYYGATATTGTKITVKELPTVTVWTKTAAGIQTAIDSLNGPGIINLPEGTYSLSARVRIPAGVTLKGAGTNKTIIKNASSSAQYILAVSGDNARITGVSIVGPGSDNYGVYNGGYKNLYIDNSEIYGFKYATTVTSGGSTTYENNVIRNNPTPGSGYGIMVTNAAYAMVRSNRFSNNRHNVAAGGNGSTATNTGYDFINNHIRYAKDAAVDVELDAHAGTHGRIRIVGNTIEDVVYFVGLRDGWGEIRNNTLKNVTGYLVRFGTPTHGGTTVTGARLRNFHFDNNQVINSSTRLWLEQGTNVHFNCRKIDHLIPGSSIQLSWNDCLAAPKAPTLTGLE